jgi:general secretion pathway protein C
LVSAAGWIDELKSGQALTRLFAERGAQLVAIVLLLLLGLDAALILTRAFGQGPALPSPNGASAAMDARPPINPALQLAVIVNAHLFGSSGVSANGEAPQTTMPLILAGVIAERDPVKGQAILGESATAAKLYAVGGAIPGGAHLHAVYSDRVLLERNGALEALMLPRTPNSPGFNAAFNNQAPARLTQASAASNPTLLAGLVRIQPVFSQGKLQGYRIFPGGGRGNSAFSQLGLRSGDLIQAVNGTPLDDAGRAMEVLQTLSSSASAQVTVQRNGASQELNLNLATLNIEPETGDNAAPGTSPDAAPAPGAAPGPAPRFRPGGANLGTAPVSTPVPGSTINAPSTGADSALSGERER